jgi:hypothetical protein
MTGSSRRPTLLRLPILAAAIFSLICGAAQARDLTGNITEVDHIPRVRPEFPIPNEPNQLFYIERSVSSNTVIYAARLDAGGNIDRNAPVEAFWRWYRVDGHKKPLNFIERMLAYGVRAEPTHAGEPITFTIAALPDRTFTLDFDNMGHPEALLQAGAHTIKIVYVYLEVIDGLIPKVPSLEVFGVDKASGHAIREHVVVRN